MSKLNTLRDEKAEELYEKLSKGEEDLSEIGIFNKGWDAHEALNLPILFMEYSANLISMRKDGHILHLLPEVSKQDRWYTEQELYDYWINNIYTP